MVAELGILETDGLDSLDPESLKAPESRVRSASAVRSRVDELKQAESIRAQRRSKIQGMLDGNKPIPPKILKDKGQGHRTNFNLREGGGQADAAKTPYYDIVFEAERPTQIVTNYADDPELNFTWSDIISDEWKELLDRWDGFDSNTQLKQLQMVVHGVGIPMWEKKMDWRWRARKVGDVLVPDGTEADLDDLEECAIPRTIMPVKLWQLIEKEESARTAGWFVERVKRAIIGAATDSMQNEYGKEWSEEYQNSLRCGDVAWNGKSNRIRVVDYLVKEFDGTITKVIILDDGAGRITLDPEKDDGFLFKKTKAFESFSQVICPFFFDIGTGEWHSIKGLGPTIFDNEEVNNRLVCSLIDGARLSAMPMVQATSSTAQQVTQINEMGGMSVLPPEFTVIQNKLADSMQGTLMVRRELQSIKQSNTGSYRPRVQSGDTMAPTLGQEQLNAAHQGQLNRGAVNRYCKSLDRLYREMVRRVLNPKLTKKDPGGKEALEFREKCMARGVPAEALVMEKICSVRATRPIGHGSEQMRMVLADYMERMLPTMDARARNTALRFIASARFGRHTADQLYPRFDRPQTADDHMAVATLENNALKQMGGEALVTPAQDHGTHFSVHFGAAQETVQALMQGQMEPMQALVHLMNAGPHMAAHLQPLSGDPTRKDQFQQMQEGFLALSKVADQLKQQIEEAAKAEAAQAQEPKISEEHAREVMKIQLDHQRKEMKIKGDLALKADKHEFTKNMKDLEKADSIRRKNAETLMTLRATPQPAPATA